MTRKAYLSLLAILPLFVIAFTFMQDSDAAQSEGTPLLRTGSSGSPVCGDSLCAEITSTSMHEDTMESKSMEGGFTYQQDFLKKEILELDLKKTALFITDPQNDFLSEGGAAWALVGEQVVADKVVEHQVMLREAAKKVGIPVFYSPHMYTEMDFKNWQSLNAIDKLMFEIDMFHQGTWGHEFHPDMIPDDNTIVMNPHKGLSNFWARCSNTT